MRQSILRIAALFLCIALVALPWMAHAERFQQGAVAADNALASRVGASVLARGGNAVDAAIATALTLGVVNPFASGIGGGGFALVYDHASGKTIGLDFRETAPAHVTMADYSPDGTHDPELSRHGGLAVGVPGELAGLVALHKRFGSLPWHELVAPAQRIARRGFAAHPLMIKRVATLKKRNPNYQQVLDACYNIDGPLHVGTRVKRLHLAHTLQRLERSPMQRFYGGKIAQDIVGTVQNAHGKLDMDDMRNYTVNWVEPHGFDFRGYHIDTFPLPSSGGIVFDLTFRGYAALQHAFDAPARQSPFTSSKTLHRFLHALTWAFAIRAEDLGDPAFHDIDVKKIVDQADIDRIVRTFDPQKRQPVESFSRAKQLPNDHGTTHFSIIDGQGNAVSWTSTVNTIYGSYLVGPKSGVLLNNEMDDFSTAPDTPNAFGLIGFKANAVVPGARPLSSMSPSIVFEDGNLVGALGGSGGPRIITATIETIFRLMGGMSTKEAIESPRIHHQWVPKYVEMDSALRKKFAAALKAKGYEIKRMRYRGNVQAIWRRDGAWDAASDSAKGGKPAGVRFSSHQNAKRLQEAAHLP